MLRYKFIFVTSVILFAGISSSDGMNGLPHLKAIKFCGTITEAQLRAKWIQLDKSKMAIDRAKLFAIAGKSGVEAQRKSLLADIVKLRIDLRRAEIKGPIPPAHMPAEFNPGSLPAGQIGRIPGYPTVFQVVDKKDALCRISRSYLIYGYSGPTVLPPGAQAPIPGIIGSRTSHALVFMSGFDFSLASNHSHVYITVPCRIVGVYKYQTAMGSTNTVPKIEPLRYLASPQAKQSKK